MSKVENKIDIKRSFGEVVLNLELPSVERLFKGLSGGQTNNIAEYLEDRFRYFPKENTAKMNIYKIEQDTVDELLESFSWTHSNGTHYEFNFDPHIGGLLSGNRINIAFLRLKGLEKGISLNFKGIFNTATLEIFSAGVKAFIESLVAFNKPLELKFQVPEGEEGQVETITI